jgi:hypothetical protein
MPEADHESILSVATVSEVGTILVTASRWVGISIAIVTLLVRWRVSRVRWIYLLLQHRNTTKTFIVDGTTSICDFMLSVNEL